MIRQFLLALILASATVMIHAVGTVRGVMPLAGIWRPRIERASPPAPVMTLTRLVGGLLVLHLLEMAVWAAMFTAAGVLMLGWSTSIIVAAVQRIYTKPADGSTVAE